MSRFVRHDSTTLLGRLPLAQTPSPINLEDLLRQQTVKGECIVIGVEEDKGRPVLPPKGVPPESIDRILDAEE